jgi:hypothetical protein
VSPCRAFSSSHATAKVPLINKYPNFLMQKTNQKEESRAFRMDNFSDTLA